MYLGRHHTGASLREIADRLGVRDISTVSHGEKRVADGLREGGAEAKELKRALDKTIHLFKPTLLKSYSYTFRELPTGGGRSGGSWRTT